MAWWRLETNGHSDLGHITAWRAIAEALERNLDDARESLDRLASSFPAFVEAERCDELALRRYGIRVSRVAEPPATVRARPEALVRLENAWAPLRASIESLAPEALRNLRPPALALDLEEIERRFALQLPEEFVAWLALHDGTNAMGPFPWKLESLVGAANRKTINDALPEFGNTVRADPGIAPVWWHPQWFPFAENGSGDALCLDLAPTSAGRVGQVIEYRHDDKLRSLVAPSFGAWLDGVAAEISDGHLVATETRGGEFLGVRRRSSLTRDLASVRIRGEPNAVQLERIRREILRDPIQLTMQVVSRLRGLGLLRLAADASGPTPALFNLYTTIARALESIDDPREQSELILRVLASSTAVVELSAQTEDVAALIATIARGDG